MSAEQILTIVIVWGCIGGIGALIGIAKEAAGLGFLLSVLLGPIGWLVTFAMDGRKQCPACNVRLNGSPSVCPGCRARLDFPTPRARSLIRFVCPHCQAALRRPVEEAGQFTKCSSCKKNSRVPVPAGQMVGVDDPEPVVAVKSGNTIDCPDCGGTVSKRATTCPHCGGPVR